MSSSPEDCAPECKPESSRSSLSGSSGAQQKPGVADETPSAPIEKTISCVSCRKRKLKCDRTKPKCGTCSRLRHDCEYPERKRNLGSKRRNMKELEARLAQVETQLVAETKGNRTSQTPSVDTTEPDWNNFTLDMNMDMGTDEIHDQSLNIPLSAFAYEPNVPALPEGNFFPQELLGLGLQEPLPPDHMIDDLHEFYFRKCHPTMPLMHKYRYLASLSLPQHMQPPICLRYAIWAQGASVSDDYKQYEDILYERARKYLELAEMKGHGETFVTVQYAQSWGLIATYEAKKTYFTRAWMSTGRMTRLSQMLGLQRLDGERQDSKRILSPAKDWIELEERRRTFWAAFYGDRWASSGTGWPMIIDEKEIQTNLPASEESFENGIMEDTMPLKEALTPQGASRLSSFAGVILSACLFGHNFQHLHQIGEEERPEDLANGEFWKRHRQMDNVLSNTFMFLPDHLRLPAGLRDMNIVFLHMNIHASTICLHQAAVLTAEKNNISKTFIRQSKARSLMAAEEIANTMKLISHLDASSMNSWMGFCLYVAGGVLIQDLKGEDRHAQSMPNLDFLVAAMNAIGKRHSVTKHFTAQLELDIETAGIKDPFGVRSTTGLPNVAMAGLLAQRGDTPLTASDLQIIQEASIQSGPGEVLCPYVVKIAQGKIGRVDYDEGFPVPSMNGLVPRQSTDPPTTFNRPYGIVPPVHPDIHQPPEGLHDHIPPSLPNWNPPTNSALDGSRTPNQLNRQKHMAFEATFFPSSKSSTSPDHTPPGDSPFGIVSFLADNTPPSDSSGSNTVQFPYRQADSNSRHKSPPDHSTNQSNLSELYATSDDWMTGQPFDDELQNIGYEIPGSSDEVKKYVDAKTWGQPPHG